MRPTTSGAAFAAANAAMIQGVDGASTVHVLLADCLGLLGAESAGVLVRVDRGLDLLAATSHRTIELELFQVQVHDGPCVETIETGASVTVTGRDELTGRWPDFGRSMSAAGYETVLASPMRWHDRVLGGLNLFWTTTKRLTQDDRDLAQSFADIATLALMQSPVPDDTDAVAQRLRSALQGRVVIERAKGVLAQTDGLGMDEAFARLVQVSEETERPLSTVARQLLDDVVTRRP
ncbi:MAG TPA: GAF and ANTAR domain-containing protein [Nocardioides sp.]|nr:GAF and ANTAR domain-containing protein [Nocardioides sp.]